MTTMRWVGLGLGGWRKAEAFLLAFGFWPPQNF